MLNQLFILHRLNSMFLPCILFDVPITNTLYPSLLRSPTLSLCRTPFFQGWLWQLSYIVVHCFLFFRLQEGAVTL